MTNSDTPPAMTPALLEAILRDAELAVLGETPLGVTAPCPRCGLALTAILCRDVRHPDGTSWVLLVEVVVDDGTGTIAGLFMRGHDLADCRHALTARGGLATPAAAPRRPVVG